MNFKLGDLVDYKISVHPKLIIGHGEIKQITTKGFIIEDVKYGQTKIIESTNVYELGTFGCPPKRMIHK